MYDRYNVTSIYNVWVLLYGENPMAHRYTAPSGQVAYQAPYKGSLAVSSWSSHA